MTLPAVKLNDPKALRGYAHPLRMALLGLLRRQGPMTATQAAAELAESVPSCSFHLRQLAKYGLAERAPGADSREKPWRATAHVTSWDDASDDPQMRAATDRLNAVVLSHYVKRAEDFLTRRADQPRRWRALTGFSDSLLYVTAAELGELTRRMDALLAEFDDRLADPARRPAGARGIGVIRMVMPMPEPERPRGKAAGSAATRARRERSVR